eukprot:350477-Chlamydomonas_euryale.AAC.1
MQQCGQGCMPGLVLALTAFAAVPQLNRVKHTLGLERLQHIPPSSTHLKSRATVPWSYASSHSLPVSGNDRPRFPGPHACCMPAARPSHLFKQQPQLSLSLADPLGQNVGALAHEEGDATAGQAVTSTVASHEEGDATARQCVGSSVACSRSSMDGAGACSMRRETTKKGRLSGADCATVCLVEWRWPRRERGQ